MDNKPYKDGVVITYIIRKLTTEKSVMTMFVESTFNKVMLQVELYILQNWSINNQ